MGRQEMSTKRPREIEWSNAKGPLPKAKSKSFELPSHDMKKAVPPLRFIVESLRGTKTKRQTIGTKDTSLLIPFETNFPITWQ